MKFKTAFLKRRNKQKSALMTSAVIAAPGEIVLERVPMPEPQYGEVIVRLEGCGVCASNLPVFEGREWFNYPFKPGAPGHEGWGWIDKIGEGVVNVAPGDRVAVISNNAFAEYDRTHFRNVIPLPRSLDGNPFPGEPLGCAVNVIKRCGISPEDTVAVIGAGFIGVLLVALSKNKGAKVIALSRRKTSLEKAKEYMADEVFSMDEKDSIEKIMEYTGGKGCDIVIEAAGLQSTLDIAADIVRERGRLVIAGYHQDGTRNVNMQLWNWKGIDVVNAHERDPQVYREGIEEAVKLVEEGVLDPSPLYTHMNGLGGLADSFGLVRTRPEGFMKALVSL